ncbi:penicillin acylase family protein [Acinetobacter baumannii]|uniref:penicillin acylase family protein n=1 Tax=Acinetobacter baumannii TaxID=470 RepID=UPI003A8960DF
MLNSRPHPTRPLIKYGTLLLGALLAGCNSSSSLDPTPAQKQITIKRDKFGTPHVYANDTYGLFYGYGYSVATDRLFQMEMSKRTGQGTVAPIGILNYALIARRNIIKVQHQQLHVHGLIK